MFFFNVINIYDFFYTYIHYDTIIKFINILFFIINVIYVLYRYGDEFAVDEVDLDLLNRKMRRAFYDNVSPRFFYAIGTPLDVTYERCCVKLCCVRLCCRFCCVNRKWNFDPTKNDLRIDALLKTSRSAAVHDSNSIEPSKIVRKCEQMFKYSNDTCGLLKLKWYVIIFLYITKLFLFF